MAARFDDAKAGWQIWRQSGFTLARDELNARLEALGHMPVSARTFAHTRNCDATATRVRADQPA